MSGIIAVYGLVIAVLIAGAVQPPPSAHLSLYTYVSKSLNLETMVDIDSRLI